MPTYTLTRFESPCWLYYKDEMFYSSNRFWHIYFLGQTDNYSFGIVNYSRFKISKPRNRDQLGARSPDPSAAFQEDKKKKRVRNRKVEKAEWQELVCVGDREPFWSPHCCCPGGLPPEVPLHKED